MNETIMHFWESLATTAVGIIVTMMGFWVAIGRNMATKAEVLVMIETQSPYAHDRQFIMERLSSNKETQTAFATALQRNADVMNELKVHIAMLGTTLEAVQNRFERRVTKRKTEDQ